MDSYFKQERILSLSKENLNRIAETLGEREICFV